MGGAAGEELRVSFAREETLPVPTPVAIPRGPLHGEIPRRTGYGFPLDIAMIALAPGAGRRRSAGGEGLPERNFSAHFAREGRASRSLPVAISPRSTPRENSGKNQIQASLPGLPVPSRNRRRCHSRARFIPDIAPDCPRPGRAGRSAKRGWEGLPERTCSIPPGRPGGVRGRRGALRLGWDEGQIGSVHLESMH